MKRKILYALFITYLIILAGGASAQVASIPFTASLDTFSVLSGTILDSSMADDVVYPNLPIGFNFNFGGTSHTVMSVNTNGYIELDSTGTNFFFNILNGSRNNIIAPLGADLMNRNANANIQYATVGTAPDRICIVQWLHYSYFAGSGDVSFQVQLHESSNCIRFVYGANSFVNAPLQTQIGLRGTSNTDYIVLGDTSCNWASAYPYPSINTTFPVSMSCSMPSGFAFDFGACGSAGTLNFSYLTGKVFNDLNGNGLLDSLETGIGNQIVHMTPLNTYVSSDASGNYTFFYLDSTLTYSLSTGTIVYWAQTNTPSVLTCNPQTQSCSGLNFGFQQIPNIHEVSINCPNWGAKPGQPEPMPIWYQNNGTSVESDTITFVMDSRYSFISSIPSPTSVNGQIIQWVYSNLMPGQNGHILLSLLPSASAVLGDFLNSTLSIAPLNDTIPGNNILGLHQLVTLAWDPNEKIAEPSGLIPAGTEINYTIHFQNTGNMSAANVTVRDTLDANLDPLSFKLLGSSHPVNFTMSGNCIATFIFYNIQLPDSGSDFIGSNGYVSYSLRTRNSLLPNTIINNRADIIFDSNIPVSTNITADTIQMILGLNGIIEKAGYLKVIPNPASGYVVFVFSDNEKDHAVLTVNSVDGKTMLAREYITSSESIDISGFPAGIYICTIYSAKGISHIRMVKE